MAKAEITISQTGVKALQREWEERMASRVQIPLEGSEADAVRSVKNQLRQMGLVPLDAAVQQMVLEARRRRNPAQ